VLLHVHEGGWALGGPGRQDQTLLRFASAALLTVVSVDYRLTARQLGSQDSNLG
jgi:acetyl esterase/lipase